MTRRQWLIRWVATPAAALSATIFGGIILDVWRAAGRFSSRHWAEAGELDNLPAEGTVVLPRQRVALICRPQQIGALSLECTHLGCLVNAVDQGFYCPCHGSEFGPLGQVWSGPAPRSLDWLPIRIRDHKVWVQAGSRLAAAAWARRKT